MADDLNRMLAAYDPDKEPRQPWTQEDEDHYRGGQLDEEARQNAAVVPYPAEWGVMPSEYGALGDALDTFKQTLGGRFHPVSQMSPEARREYLMHAATLLGLGHNPLVEAMSGKASGGAVDDVLAQYSEPVRSWPGEGAALDDEAIQNAKAAGVYHEPPKNGWDRDTLLPWAYEVKDGKRSSSGQFAMPQLGADVLNAIYGVGNAPLLGPYNPSRRDEMIEHAGAIVGPQAGIGIARGALTHAPAGTQELGMFAGRRAKTANLDALARAERLAAEGASREQIVKDTGWFKDASGEWKFEVPDTGFSHAPGKAGKLGEVVSHPAIFEAYPELRKVDVGVIPPEAVAAGQEGRYLPRSQGILGSLVDRITGRPSSKIDMSPEGKRASMLHEMQHAVDDLEGMFKSRDKANPYGFSGNPDDLAALARSREYADAPFERNARAVQARLDMTPEELASRAPWLDYEGVPTSASTPGTSVSFPKRPDGMSVLPERQALDEALSAMMAGRVPPTFVEGLKGANLHPSTASLIDSMVGLSRSAAERDPTSPHAQFGPALEAYREKAQRLGHNGGPSTTEWNDPFVYTFGGRRGAEALPMDEASRLARAREMGFDTDRTWYRGTNTHEVDARPNTWVANDPSYSNAFARGDGGNVMPLYVRGKYAPPGWSEAEAKSGGFDGRTFGDGTLQIFHPSNIRSVNAAFDPSKSSSSNLLASDVQAPQAVNVFGDASDEKRRLIDAILNDYRD